MKIKLLVGSVLALGAASVQADFVDFQSGGTLVSGNALSGNVTYEGWNDLTARPTSPTGRVDNNSPTGGPSPGAASTRPYGSHNNTAGWYIWEWDEEAGETGAYVNTGVRSTLASNLGSGTSSLWKSSGYGYLASESLHQGLPGTDIIAGGDFVLTGSAISGLETIVFQINATDRVGMVFDQLPTLSFGIHTISADFSSLYLKEYKGISFGEPQYYNYFAFQWDLTGYTFAGGEEFSINWTGLTNSGIFGLQLNQGDVFAQVVPEPSAIILLGLGIGAIAWNARRRKC